MNVAFALISSRYDHSEKAKKEDFRIEILQGSSHTIGSTYPIGHYCLYCNSKIHPHTLSQRKSIFRDVTRNKAGKTFWTVYMYIIIFVYKNSYFSLSLAVYLWMDVKTLDVLGVAGVVPLPLLHAVVDDHHGPHVVYQLPALLQHPQVTCLVRTAVAKHPLQHGPTAWRREILRRCWHRRVVDLSNSVNKDFYAAAGSCRPR